MKTYVKPELYYESFELSQHIAACDLKLTTNSIWECRVETDRFFDGLGDALQGAFVDANVCAKTYSGYEQYCYTNGADYLPKFFQS